MNLPDLLFCAFSLLGLCLVPAALGRNAWGVLLAFAALGLLLLIAPAPLHPARNVWVALALSQGPWLLLALDLMARGRIALAVDPVPLRPWLAFSLVHLLALRHLLSAAHGDIPPLFAFEAAFAGFLISLGALALWLVNRPGSGWYRGLALFWNTWALIHAVELGLRIQRTAPDFPLASWAEPSRELYGYFTGWPGALDAFFWIPLSAAIHLVIFYKIFQGSRAGEAAPETSPVHSVL